MITLESSWDYVWLFVVAGGFGAVGGLAYELLQVRAHETERSSSQVDEEANDSLTWASSRASSSARSRRSRSPISSLLKYW